MSARSIARNSTIAVAVACGVSSCLGSRPEGKTSSASGTPDGSAGVSGSGKGGSANAPDSGPGGRGTTGGTSSVGDTGGAVGGAGGAGGVGGGGGSGGSSCVQGDDCSTECEEKRIDCATSTPECKFVRNKTDGTGCSGRQFCNAGVCNVCQANQDCTPETDQCHKGKVTCIPSYRCTATATQQTNGTPCNDESACTDPDTCQDGTCTGTPVVCKATGACHLDGVCDPKTGCSDPLAVDDTPCGVAGMCRTGACQCPNTYRLCGTDVCVDPKVNRKHCGECDRDCYSGNCSDGYCQPWVVVPDLITPPSCFATDGRDLVWIQPDSGGKIRKIAATGSANTTTLVVQGETPGRMAVKNNTLVWTSTDPATQRVSLWTNPMAVPNQGVAIPLATLGTAGHSYKPVGLAVDDSALNAYFELVEDGTSATIQACTLTGTPSCRSLGPAAPSTTGDDVAVAPDYVFWTEAKNGRVVRYSLAHHTTTDVVTNQSGPYVLAADVQYVYWADRSGGSFTIKRASQYNPEPTNPENVLSTTVPGTLTSLATDGGYVYYAGLFGRGDMVGYVVSTGGSGQPFFTDAGASVVPAGLLAVANGAVYYYSPVHHDIQALVTVR